VLRTVGEDNKAVWNCSCRHTPCWYEPPKSKYNHPEWAPESYCVHLQRAWLWFRDMQVKAINLVEQHKKQMAETAHQAVDDLNPKRKITLR
jgi:hypothetical protein